MKIFCRFTLTILPIFYMYLVWQQTSQFDPESVSDLSDVLNPYLILAIGAMLEMGHLFEFGFLYFLIIWALLSYGDLKKWMEVIVIIISISYGVVDEIHQIFVPFRSFSIVDLIKNTLGVMVIAILIHKKYSKSEGSRLGLFLRSSTNFFKKDKSKVNF
ncbi:VanZ family protein [Neobacillus niacini]|uniref:VanZ family protein n=1 Tax=Neobacillus niacini TaxID=86668 RepID=UPI002FFF060B